MDVAGRGTTGLAGGTLVLMARWGILPVALAALAAGGCPSGSLFGPGDGCSGASCGGDGACDGGSCGDGGVDPCDTLVCPPGQACVEGRCRAEDPCEGVRCDNPGEACDRRDGACHPGAADDDGDGFTIAEGDCDDGDATVHPSAEERCDGADQDCDLEVDEGFPDADGDGFDTCGFGRPEQADCDDGDAARRPGGREVCDGRDNDCDDEVDEGLLPRPCSTGCGTGEERCVSGSWLCSAPEDCECAPAGRVETEPCGRCGSRERSCGADLAWGTWSTCSGEGECSPGAVEAFACGRCGSQSRLCEASCSWGALEPCSGEGACAPYSTGSCTTACGTAGTRTCDALCVWGGCAPLPESCNGADDDCDGAVDEGYRAETVGTWYSTLVAYNPTCDGVVHRWDVECATAMHRFCAARGCTVSGFGPVENSGDSAGVTCVAGASVVAVSWSELTGLHPGCSYPSSTYGPECAAAANRACAARGAVSGFGPVEYSTTTAWITCVTGAEGFSTTYGTLASHHPLCDGTTERWGPDCNAAVHRYCTSLGRTSGFGPVENWGDSASVVCVSP